MTTTDWIIDLALIGVVFLQIRSRRISRLLVLVPVGLAAWAASAYLRVIPTGGNDLLLIALGLSLGVGLGLLAGVSTKVTADGEGYPISQAGAAAAIFWLVGVGARFAFQLYATHGGAHAIARFSASHSITSSDAWTAALVLMAIGEALLRTGVVAYRGYRVAPDRFLARTSMMGVGDRAQ